MNNVIQSEKHLTFHMSHVLLAIRYLSKHRFTQLKFQIKWMLLFRVVRLSNWCVVFLYSINLGIWSGKQDLRALQQGCYLCGQTLRRIGRKSCI